MSLDTVHKVVWAAFCMGMLAGVFLIVLADWLGDIVGRFVARKMTARETSGEPK